MWALWGRKDLNKEEMERSKGYEPDLWWRKVVTIPRYGTPAEERSLRCPNCEKSAMRVGSNFRIPRRTDEKGWRDIGEMIERWDDIVPKFSICSMVNVHEEMVEEAQMRIAEKKGRDHGWKRRGGELRLRAVREGLV